MNLNSLIRWGTQSDLTSKTTQALQREFDEIYRHISSLESQPAASVPATSPAQTIVNNITNILGVQSYQGITTAMVAGTAVAFPGTFPSSLDSTHGDYVVMVRALDAGGLPTNCAVTKTPTGMTLNPDFDNSVVEWIAIARTQ